VFRFQKMILVACWNSWRGLALANAIVGTQSRTGKLVLR
jgi:hypothetical protein